MTLMDAAVVSARFPGILPPFSVTMKADDRELRWNFVDGGYSDSTGSGTALALYRALKSAADAGRAEIKILIAYKLESTTGFDSQQSFDQWHGIPRHARADRRGHEGQRGARQSGGRSRMRRISS